MFNRILVAVKFSPASLYALEKGAHLARGYGSKLHIFHALDYRLKELNADDPKLVSILQDTQKRFEDELKPLIGGLVNVKYEFRPADPALEACRIARHINADLIVLGCHQIREKMGLGRVDYVGMTILEKAHCPILLVPFND